MQIDGRQFTIEQAREHVGSIDLKPWRPSGIMIHNTGAPNLAQWMSYPVDKRIQNLKRYYEGLGWRSGPHFFVDPAHIIPFTPMHQKGTHSPSFNGTHLGIECVGDYDRDDDDKGPGQDMKRNLVALLAMLHERLGIDPGKLAMHKDDPRTTHDCPGRHLFEDRQALIQMTREAMGHGGEHPPVLVIDGSETIPVRWRTGIVNVSDLNLRENSSAGSKTLGKLQHGDHLHVYNETVNGRTKWLRVETTSGAMGYVAARFVDIAEK